MTTRFWRWLASGVRGAQAAGAELLWPRACAACGEAPLGEPPGGLCVECAATVEPLGAGCRTASCVRCAAPQPVDPVELPAGTAAPCRDCRRLDPAVLRIRAAFVYEGALAAALLRLKWQGRDDLAAPLGALLTPLLAEALTHCDVVTPVPLHPSRLRARGYNQAALLLTAGLRAGPRTSLPTRPVVTGLLRRTQATAPARAHGPHARQQRVAGAFAVAADHAPSLRGRRVLLIDDVVTTGATVSACAAALHAAGAAQVEAVALLRASP